MSWTANAAVNYRHRGGSTRLDFRGTPLLASAHGEAEVEGHKRIHQIQNRVEGPFNPHRASVLNILRTFFWAITPEGRPVNLGEVLA